MNPAEGKCNDENERSGASGFDSEPFRVTVFATLPIMNDIQELQRLASPAPKPQSLAWDGVTLWMGSRETRHLYAINPTTWTVSWEVEAPGTPWGMTAVGPELRVLCGETAEDNRIIRRCLPGRGFDGKFSLPCPDDTGSQLGWDGKRLYLSQWYPKKVLTLGEEGNVERVIAVPHGICGQVVVGDFTYLVTTDAEETNDYWLTRVDRRPATPKIEDLARIPFAARALAFDGTHFWTNHREQNQIVSFKRPD
jgi:hypothetical protein